MTFYADYPDIDGLSPSAQVEELYNKFIALSREVEFAVSHIDDKNFTSTFSKELTFSIENKAEKKTAYYEFGEDALTVYSAGIQIRKGTPLDPGEVVFYANNEGNLTLKDIVVNTATMKNITVTNGSFTIVNAVGTKVFSISNDGRGVVEGFDFCDKDIICGCLYGYANGSTGLELPSLTLAAGDYGNSYIGTAPPSEDCGIRIYSSYHRPISSSTGIPTTDEKQHHSGISLAGDVVIDNFGDGYYRYPVVGDANYKTRMYIGDGVLKVTLYNAKTNEAINTYTFTPSTVV